MSELGRGVMAVWNDLEPGRERDFDAWYQRQHVPERLSVPGFREARRYVSDDGAPRYCAFYWLEDIAVLNAPHYLDRLRHPTRSTQRMMPHFRNMARSPCTVTLDRGAGLGGAMSWIACTGDPASEAPRALLAAGFERCMTDPDVVRLQLWECDHAIAGLANPEQRLRRGADDVAAWIVFIETAMARALDGCKAAVMDALGAGGAKAGLREGPAYRLAWRVDAAEAPRPCSDEELGASFPPPRTPCQR